MTTGGAYGRVMTTPAGSNRTPNTRSGSTNVWRWTAIIPRRPARNVPRAAGAPSLPHLAWRRAYRPLWCEIWHQGGAEAEVRIRTRGWEFRVPGHVSVLDAVMAINGQRGQARDAFSDVIETLGPNLK